MLEKLLQLKPTTFLTDPFPTDKLRRLDFGSADGDRDKLIEDAFVETQSVKTFLQNKHSIIIGPIGSGKSALFNLLKKNSNKLPNYKNSLTVPIEESVSFQTLKYFQDEYFANIDEKIIYRVLWKFQITIALSEKVSQLNEFPSSTSDNEINDFIKKINAKGHYKTVLEKLKYLIETLKPIIKTSISNTPIELSASIGDKSESMIDKSIVFNLDRIINDCISSIKNRKIKNTIILIDKLDKFVAGEDYETQRKYLTALLEVEDDIYKTDFIKFKIFIRSDLFSRLNFTGLGYDKVIDNTIKLNWSNNEITSFIANRLFAALKTEKIITGEKILLSTDLSEHNLDKLNILRIFPFFPRIIKKRFIDFEKINKERDTSLSEYLDKSIITKVFSRKIIHIDENNHKSEIKIFDFFHTHFRDGLNRTTPRMLLTFLKKVVDNAAVYYEENPDQTADVVKIDGNEEWQLFKQKCVYRSYIEAINEYEINIGNIDDQWTRMFVFFQSKRGADSICKCTTQGIPHDFIGCPVA